MMKARPANSPRGLVRRGQGWALDGPGYYLWDLDPNVVIAAAADLERGRPARPTRRMLIIPEQTVHLE